VPVLEHAGANGRYVEQSGQCQYTGFGEITRQPFNAGVPAKPAPPRAYAMTERPGTDMSSGSMIETWPRHGSCSRGRRLDCRTRRQDGNRAYHRAASLNMTLSGCCGPPAICSVFAAICPRPIWPLARRLRLQVRKGLCQDGTNHHSAPWRGADVLFVPPFSSWR